jgi:hypothetical protein
MKTIAPLLILLITSCTIIHEVEPRQPVPCPHSFERIDNRLFIRIKSESESVDICISTAPNNVTCRNYRRPYFDCISQTVPNIPLFVEVYDGTDYCGEVVE